MKSLNQMRPERTKHAAKQGGRNQPSGSRNGAIESRGRSGVTSVDGSQNRSCKRCDGTGHTKRDNQ
jgi:hypothetical protein